MLFFNIHPQRWFSPGFAWAKELVWQGVKNKVKKLKVKSEKLKVKSEEGEKLKTKSKSRHREIFNIF